MSPPREPRLGAGSSIDELLDQAVAAINRGDRVTATALADHVLAVDHGNTEAEDLLAAPSDGGEIRRLTILYVDLVDSAVLSSHAELDTYGLLVGRYRDVVLDIVNRFDGHIGSPTGEGLLAVFGHPRAHEDDVRRAVLAGLEITREVARLGEQVRHRFGMEIAARAGVHRGLVYLDTAQNDVYGLGANLAARVSGLAPPGTVVISDAVAPLIRNTFELVPCEPAAVKGVAELIAHHRVLGERATQARVMHTPLVGRDREFAWLRDSWAHAQDGTLTTPGVVLRGEPGIGKSALAAAAARLALDSGAVVVTLTGSALHTDAGLHPIRSLLEQRCGISRLTPQSERLRLLEAELMARGRDMASTVPLLAPVLGIAPEHGYEPAAAEGRKLYQLIGQAVQDYLLACVGESPGMVVVEDAHWFDPSTIERLGSLLDAADGRLLVVVTGRPGPWLPADWPVKVIDLDPLTKDETDTLIAALDPNLSAHARAAVADRCDGVPFYVEQVVGGLTRDRGAGGSVRAVARAAAGERQRGAGCGGGGADRPPARPRTCCAAWSTSATMYSTASSANSRTRGCSSRGGQSVGDSVTSCFARSPRSWRRRACAAACTPRSPTPWWRARVGIPTGSWWPRTTSRPRTPARRCRRINGHRRMRDGAALSRRPAAI